MKWRGLDGREIRLSTRTKNRRVAEKLRYATEAERAQILAGGRDMKSLTNDEAWERYEVALAPHKKAKTMYNEKLAWRQWGKFCAAQGIEYVTDVRVADVSLWQTTMHHERRSPAGINTYLRTCKQIWNHLRRLELLDAENPFRAVSQLREDRQVKFLQWPDICRLVGLAGQVGRDIHLVWILGAFAGLRKAEILSARWEHVDWARERLLVEGTKSEASRNYVPLHEALRTALMPYRESDGYIVRPLKEASGKVCAYRWEWRRQWRRVEELEAAQAGIEKREPVLATPHQLRHSVATHLLDIGYTLQQVAVFLRHANDKPTRRYADLKGVSLTIDRF